MWDFVLPLLRNVLANAPNRCIEFYREAVWFMVYDRDPRRFYPYVSSLVAIATFRYFTVFVCFCSGKARIYM